MVCRNMLSIDSPARPEESSPQCERKRSFYSIISLKEILGMFRFSEIVHENVRRVGS